MHAKPQKERLSLRNWISSEFVSHFGYGHHHTNCSSLGGKREEA